MPGRSLLKAVAGLYLASLAIASAAVVPPSGLPTSGGRLLSMNGGYVPAFTVRDDSPAAPVSGGSGYVIGENLTLNDGCATHATIGVLTLAVDAVATYTFLNRGSCLNLPPNPVSVLSTTGVGTGATFTLNWGILASSVVVGSLTNNLGNFFLTNPAISPPAGFAGAEDTYVGYGAGGGFTGVSKFNTALGHNACGIGGGGADVGTASTCIGTDSGRNLRGGNNITTLGANALHDMNTVLPSAITAIGTGALQHLVTTGANPSTAVGVNACSGAVGATFLQATCLGANTGGLLNTPSNNVTLIGRGVGNTTLVGGSNVLLIGTGSGTVDTLGANSNSYMNIANTLISSLAVPTIGSGFGTSPSVSGGTSSAAFQVNVGTGGTASTGVVNFGVAPHAWACQAVDQTNPDTSNTIVLPTSTFSVTLKNYSRTTGAVTAWAASDVITVSCNGF